MQSAIRQRDGDQHGFGLGGKAACFGDYGKRRVAVAQVRNIHTLPLSGLRINGINIQDNIAKPFAELPGLDAFVDFFLGHLQKNRFHGQRTLGNQGDCRKIGE